MSDATANYLIVQYVDDPFRRETRNLGVIVTKGDDRAAWFLGAPADADKLDMRLPKWVRYPDIYRQWFEYWKETIATSPPDKLGEILTKTNGDNFNVVEGGEVTGTNGDAAKAICEFLFLKLVTIPSEKDEVAEASDTSIKRLRSSISKEFRARDIMATNNPAIKHPVLADQSVLARGVPHTPAYIQPNGNLYVMDVADFRTPRKSLIKDHAGWISKMFDDIKARQSAVPIALIAGAGEDLSEKTAQYAMAMLKSCGAELVNWLSPSERESFIRERESIARAGVRSDRLEE